MPAMATLSGIVIGSRETTRGACSNKFMKRQANKAQAMPRRAKARNS